MNNKKIMLISIIIAVILIGLVGVTYSFFNYTRTGELNNVGTGRIYFNSNQGDTINLTNIFPVKSSDVNLSMLDSLTVNINGDTTFDGGEEYLVSLTDVNNVFNGKIIPIRYVAEVSNIGTSSDTYLTSRGGNTSIYDLDETGYIYDGKHILSGYIAKGSTGINGSITIKAYVDADRIAISDTYPESKPIYVLNTNMTNEELNACVTYVTTEWEYKDDFDEGTTGLSFCNNTGTNYGGTFTQYLEGFSDGSFSQESLNYFSEHNIIYDTREEYNGTTSSWANGRIILTTDEWNNLQDNNTISFKVKVESNEGTWITKNDSIKSCPDCKFIYTVDNIYKVSNKGNNTPTVLTNELYDDYHELMLETGKNHFLGVKLNSDNQVTNGYACGVKNNVAFCIEGTSDGSKYNDNKELLQSANLWNNTCSVSMHEEAGNDDYEGTYCASPTLNAETYGYGQVSTFSDNDNYCAANSRGIIFCNEK